MGGSHEEIPRGGNQIPRIGCHRPATNHTSPLHSSHSRRPFTSVTEPPPVRRPRGLWGDKLSKQRFEDWLDALNPANPIIPVSHPSTIASEDTISVSSASESNTVQWEETWREECYPAADPGTCGECGKKIWDDKVYYETGVQTDR